MWVTSASFIIHWGAKNGSDVTPPWQEPVGGVTVDCNNVDEALGELNSSRIAGGRTGLWYIRDAIVAHEMVHVEGFKGHCRSTFPTIQTLVETFPLGPSSLGLPFAQSAMSDYIQNTAIPQWVDRITESVEESEAAEEELAADAGGAVLLSRIFQLQDWKAANCP